MVFLFEALPFNLTFSILFQHGGFDALESVLGRHYCWEFLKLMGESPRADLLCICRTVQLIDHPAHALFLLNYPPDSSIPENIRAWRVAERCCVSWSPDVQSVVLAMKTFLPTHPQHHVFQWLDASDLLVLKQSEAEWKALGRQQGISYKFTEWWWKGQREAFFLERNAVGSNMGHIIQSTAKAEIERLLNGLKRRETMAVKERKRREAWVREKKKDVDAMIRENNINRGGGKKVVTATVKPPPALTPDDDKKKVVTTAKPPPALTPDDKKKINETVQAKHKTLQSILSTVQQALQNTAALDDNFDSIAKRIAALETRNPLIKWSLRLLFHTASLETGRTLWSSEFVMQRFQWVKAEKPLEDIVRMMTTVKRRKRQA
jgi:hypothetical protein